jgi:hypothetical protein
MRRKKSVIFGFFISLLIIISILIPIGVITIYLKDYGEVKKNLHFSYSPYNISKLNYLNIDSELGNIKIEYVYPDNLDFGIDIEININISGKGLAKKSYSDIFSISFIYNQTSVNLTLDTQSDIDPLDLLSLIKCLDIIINVNSEAPLDINANLGVCDFEVYVPFGVKVYNMDINTTKGNVFYEFFNCFIAGSINGFSNLGDVKLNVIDVLYFQDAGIYLGNSNGVINFKITQNRPMGANVTGIGTTFNGEIHVIYEDNSPNTGAILSFYNHSTGWVGIENSWSGFNDPTIQGDSGYIFASFDFPALSYYNLSFYKASDLGQYSVNLSSI